MTEKNLKKVMYSWYYLRLKNHIRLVIKWYDRIVTYSEIDTIDIKAHDKSKWKIPEVEPYVYTVWKQKANLEGFDYSIPENMIDLCHEATIHHIINNPHHPEYWDKDFDPNLMFNKENRDAVSKHFVNATTMPIKYITEMIADWMATAEERKTNPYDWAKLNINKRWLLTKEQIKLIYDLLDNVWSVYQ